MKNQQKLRMIAVMHKTRSIIFEHTWLLLLASIALLLGMLGVKELWTQEGRWAVICMSMLNRHDYLHPYLLGQAYYDKPLLSYWLVLAVSKVIGQFNEWSLRLPSALSGLVSVYCCYLLAKLGGTERKQQVGLLAGWMLLTTFFFVFWAKVASADMLNVAGILAAITIFMYKRQQVSLVSYTNFFLILSLTALCKGLIAIAVVLLVLIPELFISGEWRRHINVKLMFSLIPAAIVYFLPFYLSKLNGAHYAESGLRMVFVENVVRYFQAFDHKGKIYTYLIYLPVYLLPWTFVFIPALWQGIKNFTQLSSAQKFYLRSIIILFVFFSLSSSRRSYYILPLVPFCIIYSALWLQNYISAKRIIISFFILLFLYFNVAQPLTDQPGTLQSFADQVVSKAMQQDEHWEDWQVISVGALPKAFFYLKPKTNMQDVNFNEFKKLWPSYNNKAHTIILTRKSRAANLDTLLKDHQRITEQAAWIDRIRHKPARGNSSIAYIPTSP